MSERLKIVTILILSVIGAIFCLICGLNDYNAISREKCESVGGVFNAEKVTCKYYIVGEE